MNNQKAFEKGNITYENNSSPDPRANSKENVNSSSGMRNIYFGHEYITGSENKDIDDIYQTPQSSKHSNILNLEFTNIPRKLFK